MVATPACSEQRCTSQYRPDIQGAPHKSDAELVRDSCTSIIVPCVAGIGELTSGAMSNQQAGHTCARKAGMDREAATYLSLARSCTSALKQKAPSAEATRLRVAPEMRAAAAVSHTRRRCGGGDGGGCLSVGGEHRPPRCSHAGSPLTALHADRNAEMGGAACFTGFGDFFFGLRVGSRRLRHFPSGEERSCFLELQTPTTRAFTATPLVRAPL